MQWALVRYVHATIHVGQFVQILATQWKHGMYRGSMKEKWRSMDVIKGTLCIVHKICNFQPIVWSTFIYITIKLTKQLLGAYILQLSTPGNETTLNISDWFIYRSFIELGKYWSKSEHWSYLISNLWAFVAKLIRIFPIYAKSNDA